MTHVTLWWSGSLLRIRSESTYWSFGAAAALPPQPNDGSVQRWFRKAATLAACISVSFPALGLQLDPELAPGASDREQAVVPESPLSLSLQRAYELALGRDLTYAAALASFKALQERVPQAKAALRPKVALAAAANASTTRPSTQTLSDSITETLTSDTQAHGVNSQKRTSTTSQTEASNRDGSLDSSDSTTNVSRSDTHTQIDQQQVERLETANRQASSRRVRGLDVSSNVTLTWPIYRPALSRQLEQSQLVEEQALVRLNSARQDLAVRLAQAYFEAILASESIVALEMQKAAILEQLEVAENGFKAGLKTMADVHEARAKRDAVRAQEVALHNTSRIKTTALQALVGVGSQTVQKLRVAELLNASPNLGDITYWVELAKQRAYTVQTEALALAVAKKEVAKQHAAYHPTLDFVANLAMGRARERSSSKSVVAETEESSSSTGTSATSSSNSSASDTTTSSSNGGSASNNSIQTNTQSSSQTDSLTNTTGTTQTNAVQPTSNSRIWSNRLDAYVGVRFNMTLFDGGLVNSRVRESLALQEKTELDLKRVVEEAALATKIVYLETEGYFAEAKALIAAERSGQAALEFNQLGYEVGVRINSDILNAQQQVAALRRDLIRAQVAALMGTLKLKASVGGLTEADVGGLGRWLE